LWDSWGLTSMTTGMEEKLQDSLSLEPPVASGFSQCYKKRNKFSGADEIRL
jgi:hypothetical protein